MKKLIVLLAGCALLLAACGQGGGQQETAQNNTTGIQKIGDPQKVFAQHCANCHGGNLEGAFGPPLNHIGKRYSKDAILKIIQNGRNSMPPQKEYIHPDDQKALAEWLAKKK